MRLLRQTLRHVAVRPLHAALVIGSIAAGLAANAVVFAVIDAAILRPFPSPEPERVVGIGAAWPRLNRPLQFFEALSGPEYVAVREGVPAFAAVAGFDLGNEPVLIGTTPERVFTAAFWGDPFAVLGMSPAEGRIFTADELQTGAPVALVTPRLGTTITGGDGTAVGRTLRVGGQPYTVVGIVPPRVHLYDTDLWIPMRDAPGTLPQNRRQFNVIARLSPGADLAAADRELGGVASALSAQAAAFPEYADVRLQAREWTQIQVWGFRHIATIAFAAAGALLLLITANLANVLLSGAVERTREMAVRAALGATRWHLAAQVLGETLLLTAVGAAAGVLLSWAGLRAVNVWLSDFLPAGTSLALNGPVVLFVIALSAATGALVSLAPVVQLARTPPASVLAQESGRSSGSRAGRRLQRLLVTAQVGIALIVTGSAFLLTTSVGRLLGRDAGFPFDDLLAMRITLPLPKYEGPRAMAFFDALLDRVRALPAVAEASLSNQPPPGVFSRAQFTIEGASGSERLQSAFFTTAGPRYAETFGFRLLRGRPFDERAGRGGPREVVINEAAVARFFPGEDPLGRRLLVSAPHSDGGAFEIVGVMEDVRNRGLILDAAPEIVASVRQIPERRQSQLYLVLRGRGGTDTLLADVRGVMAGIDPEQPVYAVSTVAALYRGGTAAREAAASLLGLFSALAVGLASLGLYGVVSRSVSSRTREIGIRAALGARRGSLRRLVIGDALRPLVAGILLGLALVVAGRDVLGSWVYGITPELGPLALTGVVLLVVGLVASSLPAWRASRIAPLDALRRE